MSKVKYLFLICWFCLPINSLAMQINVDVSLSHPVLEDNKKQNIYLKVNMIGYKMDSKKRRAPINISLVLDKSGSMSGEKIEQAKQAAIEFINRLQEDDIVSIVLYASKVSVLVPAARVTDKISLIKKIKQIKSGGKTALYAGVEKGASEIRKFKEKEYVNRILLLSDGLANVGADAPEDLGTLGSQLIKEGISVTTLGLGLNYNEDLMTQLATSSDGNHQFLQTTNQVEEFFNKELGSVTTVVAQEVSVIILCAEGVRPVRVLGREAVISGQSVISLLNQLYSEHERYVLIELEVQKSKGKKSKRIATVDVPYTNMQTNSLDSLTATSSVRFTTNRSEMASNIDKQVMISVTEQLANISNIEAVKLRDEGHIQEAKKKLQENAEMLQRESKKYNSRSLMDQSIENEKDAQNIEGKQWNKQRKEMRDKQQYRKIFGAF